MSLTFSENDDGSSRCPIAESTYFLNDSVVGNDSGLLSHLLGILDAEDPTAGGSVACINEFEEYVCFSTSSCGGLRFFQASNTSLEFMLLYAREHPLESKFSVNLR